MISTPQPLAAASVYDPVARLLHWSMALLIALAFAIGLIVDLLPKTWEHGIVETHKVIGLGLLALLGTRMAWRLGHRPPAPTDRSPLVARASGLGHASLYALMLAVPVIGLVYAVLRGQGLDLGLFSIPPITAAAARTVSRPVKEIHEWAAYALIGLAALHALVALWHHVVLKDGVLRRMLPRP
ncbi:cytochrome b [Bosea sp. 124]|uniref:cytochrome b n=1 Tax=Bosea sp. 124 TaxID=2135642 RepID=UPI000D3ADFC1|nr:cytochrome b [Bosea sp. 124]PTM38547.1 cytochrome b561 [Bosea sp. 124]